MSSLADKVKKWREIHSESPRGLADLVGTSRQNIENVEAGVSKQPRFLVQLAEVMEMSVEDLLNPYVEVKARAGQQASTSREVREEVSNTARGATKLRKVPLINRVPAGRWEYLTDALEAGDAERFIETTANVGTHGFALTVTGHSMVGPSGPHSFPPGTVLFVNPELEPKVGHFVVVRHNDDTEFTFKRLARDSGRWVLEPLNPKYDVLVMPPDAHICGVVVKAEINTV